MDKINTDVDIACKVIDEFSIDERLEIMVDIIDGVKEAIEDVKRQMLLTYALLTNGSTSEQAVLGGKLVELVKQYRSYVLDKQALERLRIEYEEDFDVVDRAKVFQIRKRDEHGSCSRCE